MSTVQKVIKALAMALAVFIIFCIISAISGVICSIAGINKLFSWFDEETITTVTTEEKTFNIEEINNLKIGSSIENVEIITGDEFRVVTQNVPESYRCEVEDGTLVIDSNVSNSKIKLNEDALIKVYVPEDFIFTNVELNLGVGETRISYLKTDTLELNCGAGEVDVKYIEANESANISCGVGEFDIENSKLSNLEFNAGVGEVSITSELKGECNIETGIGEIEITLRNFDENLGKIITEKGLGELKVNRRDYSENQEFGVGNDTIINIKGGVGEIDIEY